MKIEAEIFDKKDNFLTLKTNFNFDELELNQLYSVELKKYKSKRSIEQNKLMWEIINRISKETQNDEWDIYCHILEKADCKSEFLMILPEAYEMIKKTFRASKICEHRQYNGKDMLIIKAFIGSSKFDTKEMTELINYCIQVAAEQNIYIKDLL